MDGFWIKVDLRNMPVEKEFGPIEKKSTAEKVLKTLAGREDVCSAHIVHKASSSNK